MILPDKIIESFLESGKIQVGPYDNRQVQSASIDIRLGTSFAIPVKHQGIIEFGQRIEYEYLNIDEDGDGIILGPKQFMLATTAEYIVLPEDIAAFVEGRSSIGRMGLFIQNAGWVDPGFRGEITLELFNGGENAIRLVPGHRVGQLVLVQMLSSVKRPYRGKYWNQVGATGSRKYLDEEYRKEPD